MAANDDRIEYLMADAADARAQSAEAIDAFDRAELDDLRALLADPSLWDEPSSDLGDAVVASITAAAAGHAGDAGGRTSSVVAPARPRSTTSASPAQPASSTRPARRFRGLAVVGSAALGAAAAALVAVAVVNIGDESSPSKADAQIALVGTDLLPGAAGRADITTTPSGVQIQLDVANLPRRDGTEFYEAWLKSVDGTGLIPIGTFHSGGNVTLWAGVAIEDYPILTVTKETVAGPKDPAQGSSGEVVVSGRLNP
jgi:hypothetical protein